MNTRVALNGPAVMVSVPKKFLISPHSVCIPVRLTRRTGACCPKKTLECNYGEAYCGTTDVSPNDVCWSNCDAKAECGKNAAVKGKKCPLNVCCSAYGFCGTTEDFCKVGTKKEPGCQSNCEQPGPTHKSLLKANNRIIGYYEAWAHNKTCQGMVRAYLWMITMGIFHGGVDRHSLADIEILEL